MQLRTFSAASMAEALLQVKHELGGEAVIVHTRSYHRRRWLGLRRVEVVEITAGSGLNVAVRPRAVRRTAANVQQQRTTVTQRRAAVADHPAQVAPPPAQQQAPRNMLEGSRQLLETPAANAAAVLHLTQEVNQLKALLQDVVTQQRASRAPHVPEELVEYYSQLIQNQVAEELAADVIKSLRNSLRPDQVKQPQIVREKLAELLERLLPVSGPIQRKKAVGPHVVALIGPTGVGKTTTIAKLAANLKLSEGRSVGLITIDTYRIAAVDQLRKYAEILGSPLRVVNTPDELREAVASMEDCEYVLIDTAGRSPTDSLKLQELRSFLNAAAPDEVHLVVSSTASQECIESAVARFGNVRVDKIIFTKLDEAVHVGVMLNVVRRVNKSLSYVTTGQDVPDDIEVGRGRRLAQLILGAASPPPAADAASSATAATTVANRHPAKTTTGARA